MKFINYIEKRKFDDYWERESEIMRKAGLSEIDISLLYTLDWDWYKSRRRYSQHNTLYEAEVIEQVPYGEAEDLCDLFLTESFSLESVDNKKLYFALKKLKESDYDLVIKHIVDEIPVKDIARSQGCSVSNITKKLRRIFLLLRNNFNQ